MCQMQPDGRSLIVRVGLFSAPSNPLLPATTLIRLVGGIWIWRPTYDLVIRRRCVASLLSHLRGLLRIFCWQIMDADDTVAHQPTDDLNLDNRFPLFLGVWF